VKNPFHFFLNVLVMAAYFGIPPAVHAASRPLFAGNWRAIDVDGSDLRLTVAGRRLEIRPATPLPWNGPYPSR
jgi:hypothetical protein